METRNERASVASELPIHLEIRVLLAINQETRPCRRPFGENFSHDLTHLGSGYPFIVSYFY